MGGAGHGETDFVQPTLEKRTIKNGAHGQQQKARVVCGSNKSFARYGSRYGRLVWAGRSLALTLSLLCLALLPTFAYAAGYSWGTVDGPFTTGHSGHDSGYVVLNVSNQYDAALCVIGRGSDKIQLTNDEFALLSNAETGGAFYELANEFFAISGSEGGNSYASWWGDVYFQILSVQAAGGEGHVWAVETSQGQITAALNAYQAVRNGDVTGGSGGNSTPEGYVTFSGNMQVLKYGTSNPSYLLGVDGLCYSSRLLTRFDSTTKEYVYYDGSGVNSSDTKLMSCPITVHVSSDMFANVSASDLESSYICVDMLSDGGCYVTAYQLDNVTYGTNSSNYNNPYGGMRYINGATKVKATGRQKFTAGNGQYSYSYDGSVLYLNRNGGSSAFGFGSSSGNISYSANMIYLPYGAGEVSGPTVPPTNWPEEVTPTTPTPPTLPNPTNTTNPVQPDTPSNPSSPIYITQPTYTTNTYTADLQGILDALDEHCQHLQSALYANIKSLNDNLMTKLTSEFSALRSTNVQQFGWLGSLIGGRFDSLTNFLQGKYAWLDETLEYYFGDLDTYLNYFYTSRAHMVRTLDDVLDELRALDFAPTDLGGVYTRLDAVSHDLDLMVADVEQVVQALNNLADTNGLSTVRGYLKGIYDWLTPFQQDLDMALATLEADLSFRAPDGARSLSVTEWLYEVYCELSELTNDLLTRWLDLRDYLDSILTEIGNVVAAIEDLTLPTVPRNPVGSPPSAGTLANRIDFSAWDDAVAQLMRKFPFSIVSNIAMIWGFLTRPAAVPVYDLAVPNPSDWSTPYVLHISLEDWDGVAAMLRMGIMVWAISRVARRTLNLWTRDEGAMA